MSASKQRKVDLENRAYNPVWREKFSFIDNNGKPLCLICMATLSVFKQSNIQRHFEKNHVSYVSLDASTRKEALSKLETSFKKQSSLFLKATDESEKITRASYDVSLRIAIAMKPFTEGSFVKECMLAVADSICPEKKKEFANISLSARTVSRRVEEMATDVRLTLKDHLKTFTCFSVALDESTDVKDTSQLVVFIRGVTEDMQVNEEFLGLVPLKSTTTGQNTGCP